MTLIRTLIFHGAIAPYRIDLFNRLHDRMPLRVVFFNNIVLYHPELDQDYLRASLHCQHEFLLNGLRLAGRTFRIGMGRIIETFIPDVVVTHEFSYATLAVMLNRKLFPKHRFAHVLWSSESPHLLHHRGGVRLGLRRFCSKHVDAMIVYSKAAKEAFHERIDISRERMFVCANLQDEKVFASKLDRARIEQESFIQRYCLADKKILLFVGRLDPVKNLNRLFAAFSHVANESRDAQLVLVGGGPQRSKLEDLAGQLRIADQVLFLGHCKGNALLTWYLLAAVLVLTSLSETYGAVVNEALLSGIPVICSSHAGASVLIREHKNGWICDPYNVEQIASLLRKSLVDAETADVLTHTRRQSLMPIAFERDVASFFQAVEYAAKQVERH